MNRHLYLLLSVLLSGSIVASFGCSETSDDSPEKPEAPEAPLNRPENSESSPAKPEVPEGPLKRPRKPREPLPEPRNASIRRLPVDWSSIRSGATTRQRLIVRDAASWAEAWSRITGPDHPTPPLPAVDFASNVVIIASMGTQPTLSPSITIDDIRITNGNASIIIIERTPGRGCLGATAISNPIAAAAVPLFAGKATFLERTSEDDC